MWINNPESQGGEEPSVLRVCGDGLCSGLLCRHRRLRRLTLEGLPGLALAACPWALGRAPSVPGGGRGVRNLSPKDRANVASRTLLNVTYLPPATQTQLTFYWDVAGGNGWHVTPCFLDASLRTCRNEPSSSSVSDPRHWLQHALFTLPLRQAL